MLNKNGKTWVIKYNNEIGGGIQFTTSGVSFNLQSEDEIINYSIDNIDLLYSDMEQNIYLHLIKYENFTKGE